MNNVLGMRSGYTCCLANMHQGWTKFASHLWYAAPNNGLAALEYSPNELVAMVGKEKREIRIDEQTSYPFGDEIRFVIKTGKPVAFPFHLRIPGWCNEAVVLLNGQPLRRDKGGQVIVINGTWKDGDQLTLQLPMQVTTSNWGRNSRAVERGPLVYALKLKEDWEKGVDEKEGDYYSVSTKDEWNFGLVEKAITHTAENVSVTMTKPVGQGFAWNLANAPVELKAPAKIIPVWKLVDGVATQPVTARDGLYMGEVEKETKQITLVPYGCTKVRIVAFPVVR
jgi:DUF1680 family protein